MIESETVEERKEIKKRIRTQNAADSMGFSYLHECNLRTKRVRKMFADNPQRDLRIIYFLGANLCLEGRRCQ